MFSGVSIDWEYISNNGVNYGNTTGTPEKGYPPNAVDPSDAENFALFVQTLRGMFDQKG